MATRDSIQSRGKILLAAEKVFAQAGFNGATVDAIAAEAGVNKALIYYYFKNKNQLLDMLIHSMLDEAGRLLNRNGQETADATQGDALRQTITLYVGFLTEKKNIIRVAFAQAVKSSGGPNIIIGLGNLFANAEIDRIQQTYERNGMRFPFERQDMLVSEFFMGFLPLINFALFSGDWQTQFDLDGEELYDKFFSAYKKARIAAQMMDG